MTSVRVLLVLAVLSLGACAAWPTSDQSAPAWRGRAIAARNCGGCHNLNREGVSTFRAAPPFREIGLDPRRIRDFAADLRRHHPDGMPQIVLSEEQAQDLYAYIRTLSGERSERLPDVPPCFMRVC